MIFAITIFFPLERDINIVMEDFVDENGCGDLQAILQSFDWLSLDILVPIIIEF